MGRGGGGGEVNGYLVDATMMMDFYDCKEIPFGIQLHERVEREVGNIVTENKRRRINLRGG